MSKTQLSNKSAEKLAALIDGQVHFDSGTLRKFSHDQSIYEIQPLLVVFPDSIEDLQKTVHFAKEENISVTMRGGGSGTAGAALGSGIVVAFSKNRFSKIGPLDSNGNRTTITTQAGVYNQHLQNHLLSENLYLPIDPTSSPICQIGGNIATKASGPHAFRHGSIDNFIESIEFITSTGEIIHTKSLQGIPEKFTTALTSLQKKIMADEKSRAFVQEKRKLKTASGYNIGTMLDEIPPHLLINKLFAGSIGTFGLITKAALRVIPAPAEKAVSLYYFSSLQQAGDAIAALRKSEAVSLELMNRQTFEVLHQLVDSSLPTEHHLLFVEFEGSHAKGQAAAANKALTSGGITPDKIVTATNDDAMHEIWQLRKRVLPTLGRIPPPIKALGVVNDVGVPHESIPDFLVDITRFFAEMNMDVVIYGHAGSGNFHLRPLFDLSKNNLIQTIQHVAEKTYDIVLRHSGTITAEHGMGRLRAPFLQKEWGEKLYGYMKELKQIFDPHGIFNPDVMFSKHQITENLRPDLVRKPK